MKTLQLNVSTDSSADQSEMADSEYRRRLFWRDGEKVGSMMGTAICSAAVLGVLAWAAYRFYV